ncbi:MAG: TPR end-of-group domain-containing protein [Opitutales bacterium]
MAQEVPGSGADERATFAEKTAFERQFYESLLARDRKDTRVVELLGHLYTQSGMLTDGLKMDRKLVRLKPEDPTAHYNLACSLALKNRKKEAVEALQEAVNLGYEDAAWIQQDDDLENLRGYPAFEAILDRLAE